MSLFDVIRGSLYLLGGMREADLEEEKVRGTLDVARERTAAEKESAAAQRALTERLQESAQTFTAGENVKERGHQIGLENMKLGTQIAIHSAAQEAETARLKTKNVSDRELTLLTLKSHELIAELQNKLGEKGLQIEWAKLKKMMPWQLEFILKTTDILSKEMFGEGGLFTGTSTQMGFTQSNMDLFTKTLGSIMGQVDADGKLGLKGMALPRIIVGTPPSAPAGFPGQASPAPPQAPMGPSSMAPQPMPLDRTAPSPVPSIHPKDEYKINLWAGAIKNLPPDQQDPALKEYSTVMDSQPFDGFTNQDPVSDVAYRELLRKSLQQRVKPYSFTGK